MREALLNSICHKQYQESWGRGIEKICGALEADGLPKPEYLVNPEDIMVKFTGPEDRIIRVTDRVTEKVTDKEREILKLIYEDPGCTTSVMAEKLSVTRKTVGVYIKSLKEKNVIERVGSDRKGYWRIK